MLPRDEFAKLVADAYQQLYDLVRLRSHPLADALQLESTPSRKERAWQLHHLLLEVIEELDPGPQAPTYSHEWCRYRLMRLRYVNGMDPPAVAKKIAVSRRQYYREHDATIEAIAELLWQRYVEAPQAAGQSQATPVSPESPALSRIELLRLEVGRASDAGRFASVDEVAHDVRAMLQEMLRQRSLTACIEMPGPLPSVAVDRSLLRQMMVGVLGYLSAHAESADVRLAARVEPAGLCLSLIVEPPSALAPLAAAEIQERLSAWNDLAALSGARIAPIREEGQFLGFDLQLPLARQRTILVIDDNEDVLALFQRYLGLHAYRVVTAETAHDALQLAREIQPDAITLDLMMPEQDGWDILQILLNQPDTRDIPIIVCSVLREKDLALSLGATAFLEKPITEQALVDALEALGA